MSASFLPRPIRPVLLALAFVAALPAAPLAAQPAPPPAEAPASLVVMNLAAHPDDEDGRTLAYYRGAKNAVAYSVVYTRGEGGQNEIGPELYEELGAIRTRETGRAARILGTQVFFLNYKDFGYSKFAREAFDRWGGEDAVTARLVYLIRKLKPDVLFTNHDTTTVGPRRQHGHHQAVGVSAYNAFALAADPAFHPEQLDEPGVDLWQPKRLFLRHWRAPDDYDVRVHVDDVDPHRGASYAEIAAAALSEHASQGMDFFARNRRIFGDPYTYFSLLRSATDAPLDSLDLAGNLPPNTAARPDLAYMIDAGRLPGLPPGAVRVADSVIVPGQSVVISWELPDDTLLTPNTSWTFEAPAGSQIVRIDGSDPRRPQMRLTLSPDAVPTTPEAVYQYERFTSRPPVYFAVRDVATDSVLAAGYVPLAVAPPLFLEPTAPVVRLHPGSNTVEVRGRNYTPDAADVDVLVDAVGPDDWRIADARLSFRVDAESPFSETVSLDLPGDLPAGDYAIRLTARLPEAAPARIAQPARVLEARVAEGLRVGVVESYDNTLDQALHELGVEHVLLDSLDLVRGAYRDLHTVVVDIRAYLVRQDLRQINDELLDWVRDGGHLIVNYQKTFEWNAGAPDPFVEGAVNPDDFAPYPLELGRDRITYEDAPVTVLEPGHPLFRYPNAVEASAWDGWVQERGLYFPEDYDDRYVELLSMADPGEEPLRSSTLLAEYGDGTYLYTALGWYRQLKEFHPGAYRMFANMISLPLAGGPSTAGTPEASASGR